MNVEIRRDLFTSISTQGKLALNGIPECFTLEPPKKMDGSKPRCIDPGTYPLTIRWSFDHNAFLPHVENVPGFTAIEQHVGNVPHDTLGCTLVGRIRGPQPNWVGQSLAAYAQLIAKYMAAATLTNPDDPERLHIWDVGTVTYSEVHNMALDVNGEISA